MVALPLVWWCLGLIGGGWIPQGDEALIAIRTHDALSTHPPLLGMRSTTSLSAPDAYAHHPGPMEFYVLALPYLFTGSHPAGLLIGCLITTLGFVAIALHSAYRAGRVTGVLAAAAVVVVLEYIYGSLLVLPLNTFPPIMGLLATLMLGWRLVIADLRAMPWYALCASYTAQAHVAFAPVVVLLTLVLAVIGWVRWRSRRSSVWPVPGFRREPRVPWWRRRGWVTVCVAAVCWLPVAVDGPSNVVELVQYVTAPGAEHVGLPASARYFLTLLLPVGPLVVKEGLGLLVVLLFAVSMVHLGRQVCRGGFSIHGSAERLLALHLVAVICCLPLIWMGSRVNGGLRLHYLDLLLAAPVLLTVATVWSSARMLKHPRPARSPRHLSEAPEDGPGRLDRARAFAQHGRSRQVGRWAAAVLGAALALGLAAHVSAYQRVYKLRSSVAQARSMVPEMARVLSQPEFQGRPIVVQSSGQAPWLSIGPALEAQLVADGRSVYFDGAWPSPEYDAFRRVDKAPEDAMVVLLRERPNRHEKWSAPASEPTARVVTYPLADGSGKGRLQMLILKDPVGATLR